jgi:hypothetical protein
VGDDEIVFCAAEACGRSAKAATVEPMTGKQGLIVCRVRFVDDFTCIFKAVREVRKHEIAISLLLCKIAVDMVPWVLGSDEDVSRGLYWFVMEDLGTVRLADRPSTYLYARAGHDLASLQMASMEHADCLAKCGVPQVSIGRWEEIALHLLETALQCSKRSAIMDFSTLEEVVWNVSRLARDAEALPLTLIHGDLHAANISIGVCGESVKLMDWGSSYMGSAFLALEELLWPAARHLKTSVDIDQVRTAYLRAWAPILGKPGHLQTPLAACRALVRMELLLEALRPTTVEDTFAIAATFNRMVEAYRDWKKS